MNTLMKNAAISQQNSLWRWVLVIVFTGLTGCASNQSVPDKVDDNALYEGRSTVSFSNLPVAETAEQGIGLGDQQLRAGEFDKALYMYIQAMQLDKKNTDALYKIGWIHLDRGNTGKAVMAFEGVLAQDPKHIYGNEALGIVYLKSNRYAVAHKHFAQAVESDKGRLAVANTDGTSQRPVPKGKSDDEDIAAILPETDNQSPSHAYNGLGVIADLKGDHKAAQGHYERSLAITPHASITLNNQGYSYYLSNQWVKAEAAYKQALRFDSKSPQAWRNLGLLYARQENYLSALMAFEQVMDSADAHNDVGYICLLEGKYDTAEYYFEKAISLLPTYYEKASENLKLTQRLREKHVTQR